jgi:hypothetical protein
LWYGFEILVPQKKEGKKKYLSECSNQKISDFPNPNPDIRC